MIVGALAYYWCKLRRSKLVVKPQPSSESNSDGTGKNPPTKAENIAKSKKRLHKANHGIEPDVMISSQMEGDGAQETCRALKPSQEQVPISKIRAAKHVAMHKVFWKPDITCINQDASQ